jgi:hypothetical protein
MSHCMSIPPFDSDSILNWFALEINNHDSSERTLRGSAPAKTQARAEPEDPINSKSKRASDISTSPSGESTLSQIAVNIGSDIVNMSVPIDLLCSLLLTSGGNPPAVYTLQDILLAGENLKRFREVSGSPSTMAGSGKVDDTPASFDSELPITTSGEVDLISMCLDSNGSAVVQEMISKASSLELELIFNQISCTAVLISINTHGCRVVQRALDFGTTEQITKLFKSIPPFKLVDLCVDVNGNHVMQKFVETLSPLALHEFVMTITDPSTDGFSGGQFSTISRLSLHSYGCRVVQRLLVRCSEDDRAILLGFIITAFPELVADQFGNYVAQHALEYSNESERKSIISTLTLMDVFDLCCNKFASNVIEKAVRCRMNDKTILHRLIATIIQSEEGLLSLMKDKYGNYVVKAICDLSPTDYPEVLYVKNLLIAHSATLKKYTYGYHLVEKLERSANGNRSRSDSNVSQSSGERRTRGYSRNL